MMKGDFSRQTFRKKKHYSGVLDQQGRLTTDADRNERQAIHKYRSEVTASDVIGPSGTPKHEPGFDIAVSPAGDLVIRQGRTYVDGLLCENEQDVTYLTQPDPPSADGVVKTLADQNASVGLVYLDVWERHVTALDDPHIREVALGGPDTATRLQVVWQAKILPLPSIALTGAALSGLVKLLQEQRQLAQQIAATPPPANISALKTQLAALTKTIRQELSLRGITCDAAFAERSQLVTLGDGMLNARTVPPTATTDACVLPPTAGYQRLENQLYRVEVHKGGTRNQATFKWSRENGSVVAAIKNFSGAVLTVDSVGRDAVLGFSNGDWGEIVDDQTERRGLPGQLVQIKTVDPDKNMITLETTPTAVAAAHTPKLRRWDHEGLPAAVGNGIAMSAAWIDLEGGIQVQFAPGHYRTGEYWLIPARTASGDIEWPRTIATPPVPIAQPPEGVRHHFADLALVVTDSAELFRVGDCRAVFPALTDIHASDVIFDNTACALPDALTVQDALDQLCQRKGGGTCRVVVTPEDDLQAVFDKIADHQDADICFQVGTYTLPAMVTLRNKGHLKLVGAGQGTRLIAAGVECALWIEGSPSVIVRDLYAETGATGAGTVAQQNLKGTLTFRNCADVTVETVTLRCAAGTHRAATCLTVRNDPAFADFASGKGLVRVRGCTLSVGHQQTGILVVNGPRTQVEDNVLQTGALPAGLGLDALLADKTFRDGFRRLLLSDLRVRRRTLAGGAAAPADRVRLEFGNFAVDFRTDTSLADKAVWAELVKLDPPTDISSPRAVAAYMVRLIDNALLNPAAVSAVPAFAGWLAAAQKETEPVASQGIVIGGREADDIRVLNNTVQSVLQGIHVGLSHREGSRGAPDRAARVSVTNNTVAVVLPPTAVRERHGIFVGNCESLLVTHNYLTLRRTKASEQLTVEGIRVWGHLGRNIDVVQNHIVGFPVAQTVKRGGKRA